MAKNIRERIDEPQEVPQAQDTPPQQEPVAEPKPKLATAVRITHQGTPVRVGPGAQYAAEGMLNIGDAFPLVRHGKWLPVLHIGCVLWACAKDAIVRDGVVIVTEPTSPRLGPGLEFDATRPFGVGHRFIKPSTTGWRLVRVGWISERFSEEVPADE